MTLTPERKAQGRRNFMKAIAGTPAVAALAGAAALSGPKRGGPVRAALIGAGSQGKVLLGQCPKNWIDLRAIGDINPAHARAAADAMAKAGWARPREYQDTRELLAKEDVEAVIIATPLFTHADLATACLDAGKHVLCEKMMAWDVDGARRMHAAAQRQRRVLEIGHQRFYNPIYQAAFAGILGPGQLGDVHYVNLVWHRNGDWRRDEPPPDPPLDPTPWGYESWEHLRNWRLYKKYSRGLLAELGSHQTAIANWVFGAAPTAVYAAGGVHRYRDGREVPDHVYATFEYDGGRTATFTSIQSNKFEGAYEEILGTKGALIFNGETEAYFFPEGDGKGTTIDVAPRAGDAVARASESRVADATGRTMGAAGAPEPGERVDPLLAYRNEIAGFCAAIRAGVPLRCGPERALQSALACVRAAESVDAKQRLSVG